MRKLLAHLLTLSGAVVLASGTAYADPYVWAQDIKWVEGANVSEQRSNEINALGAPDAPAIDDGINFLSLGIGGYAVFDFGVEFNEASVVFETTWGNPANWVEAVSVYAISENSGYTFDNDPGSFTDWTRIGSYTNANAEIGFDVDGPFRYLALLDVTQNFATVGSRSYNGDGFDVNAVGVAPVPEPATMLLFGTGLIGLAGAARRKKK